MDRDDLSSNKKGEVTLLGVLGGGGKSFDRSLNSFQRAYQEMRRRR